MSRTFGKGSEIKETQVTDRVRQLREDERTEARPRGDPPASRDSSWILGSVWTVDGRTVLSTQKHKDMMKRWNKTHEGVFPPFLSPRAKVNLVHYVK